MWIAQLVERQHIHVLKLSLEHYIYIDNKMYTLNTSNTLALVLLGIDSHVLKKHVLGQG